MLKILINIDYYFNFDFVDGGNFLRGRFYDMFRIYVDAKLTLILRNIV